MHISKPAGPLPAPVPFYRQLYFQVVVAIVLGALLGHFEPAFAESLKPLGDAFIKLVKMIIAPVIFLTIVTGIAGMTHLKTVGRVFAKSMTYFLFFSTLALIVGMVVAHAVQPGAGMNINPAELDQSAVNTYVQKSHELSLVGFLMDIIPATLISAFVDGNILQVLFVAVLFGIALALVGERGRPVLSFLEALTAPVFRLVHMLMKAAPIGAFGAIAFTIGKYGVESLVNLAWLVGSFYLTSLFFVLVILGIVCRLCGFSVLKLIRYLKAELLLVLGTSSSESALPSLMEKMEKAGCEKSVVGLVVPTGYSFNLDGTAIYLTMGALFVADAMGKPLQIGEQIALLVFMIIASKGAAGVTGAGIATLAAGLQSHRPDLLDGVDLIVGIDRFMSEARALTNFSGNAVATLVLGAWVKEVDKARVQRVLSGAEPFDETTLAVDPHASVTQSAPAGEVGATSTTGTPSTPPPAAH